MEKPLITVIVPVYNMEKYLKRCIDSIKNQSYKNLEILLIDDGSTDKSLSICEKYAENDTRIKVYHQENKGVSNARNFGLSIAKGMYIGFVDSDDYISKYMYEVLVAEMDDVDVDMVACGYNYDIDNKKVIAKNKKEILKCIMSAEEFMYYAYNRDEYKGVTNYIWCKLYSKELIDRINLRFNQQIGLGEDIEFNTLYYLSCKHIKYVNQPLYYYCIRNDSISNDIQKDRQEILLVYERIIEISRCNQVDVLTQKYIKRFYVYWCGRCIEYFIAKRDKENIEKTQKKANKYLAEYLETNKTYPERVEWIQSLLNYVED